MNKRFLAIFGAFAAAMTWLFKFAPFVKWLAEKWPGHDLDIIFWVGVTVTSMTFIVALVTSLSPLNELERAKKVRTENLDRLAEQFQKGFTEVKYDFKFSIMIPHQFWWPIFCFIEPLHVGKWHIGKLRLLHFLPTRFKVVWAYPSNHVVNVRMTSKQGTSGIALKKSLINAVPLTNGDNKELLQKLKLSHKQIEELHGLRLLASGPLTFRKEGNPYVIAVLNITSESIGSEKLADESHIENFYSDLGTVCTNFSTVYF